MADVIRRAIIEIETRQKRSRLEAPGASGSGFKAESDAFQKMEEQLKKSREEVKKLKGEAEVSTFAMAKGFREAGEGAFRTARGIALLSANGSDDMKKLVQQVALAQGAFDVFAGSFKTVTSLAAVLGGPAAAGIAATTVAITAGAVAWTKWKAAAREALEEAAERAQRVENAIIGINKTIEKDNARRVDLSGMLIGSALTDRTRQARLREAYYEEIKFGAKAERGAATSTETGGREKLEFVGHKSQLAAGSAERQSELLKQIYGLQKEEHQNVTRAASQLTSLGVQGAAFGGGNPTLSAIGVFGAQAAGSTVNTRLEGQLTEHTQSLERLLANLARIITFYTRKTDEISTRINGANPN